MTMLNLLDLRFAAQGRPAVSGLRRLAAHSLYGQLQDEILLLLWISLNS